MISKTTTRLTVLLVLILGGVLLFAQQPLALAAPQLHGNTPTPAPEEEHDDTTEAEAANDHAETAEAPTLETLAARIAALEAEVAALHTGHAGAQTNTNEVTTAIYLLDNAGLHDLDVRLNEAQDLQSGDAGKVERVARLLATVDWPEALATTAMSVTTTLDELAVALADDDLAAAAPLATVSHEVAHDLSHAAEHWLDEALGAAAHDDEASDDHADTPAADDHADEGEDDHSDSSGG